MVRSAVGLTVFVGACLLAAYLGSLFTRPSIPNWYAALDKPSWTPPNWVFAPVWTGLYVMMGVAAWLVWREYGFRGASVPLTFFAIQLLLNVGWSAIFFGARMPGAAFAEIAALWTMILATTVLFYGVRPLSALLLVPYLGWVAYAAALNFAIWRMNA